MRIKGLLKLSLIDYPGRLCSVVFVSGCNFRCPYCQNPDLVNDSEELPELDEAEILRVINARKKYIDGVCITGGEPTIHKDLADFCRKIKTLGLLVKLDTNGSNPKMVKELIAKKLVDFVSVDIKAALAQYSRAAGIVFDTRNLLDTIDAIKSSGIEHEFRVTAVPGIVDKDGIRDIARLASGSKLAIQQFVNKRTLDERYQSVKPYSADDLQKFKSEISGYVKQCEIRNLQQSL